MWGIHFVLARYIEKRYTKKVYESIKKNNKRSTIDPTEIRGGDISNHLLELLIKDLAIKTGIVSLIGTIIWADTVDTSTKTLINYGSSLLASPGKNLLDSELLNADKIELLRLKIKAALRQYKGSLL